MENQTEKFRCPYCGKVKDISEKNYNTEYGNFRPTTEKLGDIRDAYDYKHINYKYTQYEVPICDDCLIIHNEAGFKANIIALCVFLPIAFYLLTRYSGFWEFIIPTGFIGVVCVFVRWLCKAFLVSRKGIYYHAHNNISYTSIEDDPFQIISNYNKEKLEIEKREKERIEKIKKRNADWEKHHEYFEVDMGGGNKAIIGRYISDYEIFKRERDKGNVDFSKIKKFEEGVNIDYDDEDFEGHFV